MTENGRPPYPHVYQINVSDGGVPKRPVLEAFITKAGVERRPATESESAWRP